MVDENINIIEKNTAALLEGSGRLV